MPWYALEMSLHLALCCWRLVVASCYYQQCHQSQQCIVSSMPVAYAIIQSALFGSTYWVWLEAACKQVCMRKLLQYQTKFPIVPGLVVTSLLAM